jgi:hypothetical protein
MMASRVAPKRSPDANLPPSLRYPIARQAEDTEGGDREQD